MAANDLDGATVAPSANAEAANAGEFAARWNSWTGEQREAAFIAMRAAARESQWCFTEDHARALAAERASTAELEHRLACLLTELTDGRMSGTAYDVPTMVREVEAAFERSAEEDLAAERKRADEAEAERADWRAIAIGAERKSDALAAVIERASDFLRSALSESDRSEASGDTNGWDVEVDARTVLGILASADAGAVLAEHDARVKRQVLLETAQGIAKHLRAAPSKAQLGRMRYAIGYLIACADEIRQEASE